MNAHYSFLPYVRQGLAGEISSPDDIYGNNPANEDRVNIAVNLTLQETSVSSGAPSSTIVTRQVSLKGPGDIIGINSTQIVKVYPKDWTTNFEPNYLPYIEFYDEDFPWRYTPSQAILDSGDENRYRLRPWLSLIVLKENEFADETFQAPLASIAVNTSTPGAFPSEQQTWAWAHVHVNDDLGAYANAPGSSNIDPSLVASSVTSSTAPNSFLNKVKTNPDIAVSRIMCPRRLEPNTSYHAFLIPSFEVGRLAGLGEPVNPTANRMQPSWSGATVNKRFPVYHRWYFKTGVAGDFESLVRMLKPKVVGFNVGKRAVDLQLPGNPSLETAAVGNVTPDTIGLQGALKPVGQAPDGWSSSSLFSLELKELLNNPALAQPDSPDPIIGPPIYGRWHVQMQSLGGDPTSDWLNKVNQDPRYRIFAGIGAEVVRKNQDKYMDIAWTQIGEVVEANRKLRLMQLAQQASQVMHDKHVKSLSNELVLNIAGPVHTKVLSTTLQTVYKVVADSNMPNEMFSGAFRRMTSPGSPLMRGLATAGVAVDTESLIADVNNGSAATAFPYTAPVGMVTLTAISQGAMSYNAVTSLPTWSNFTLTAPVANYPIPIYGSPSANASAFVPAIAAAFGTTGSVPNYSFPSGNTLVLSNTASDIKDRLEPRTTVLELARNEVKWIEPAGPTPVGALAPVLAAPKINLPMYKELVGISTEWLMPGLNTIPDNSISLLEMNQDYIEAYMLGANYEMARELAWRGYPTDQRGTYFSYFWGYNSSLYDAAPTASSLDDLRDIYDIQDWKTLNGGMYYLSALGANSPRLNSLGSNVTMLILTVRGELFRRYPGVRIYLQKAKWTYNTNNNPPTPILNQPRVPDPAALNGGIIYPVFSAEISPDVYFLGFPVDAATVKGTILDGSNAGYFFVFQEQAGEVKFGADEPEGTSSYTSEVQIAPGSGASQAYWNDLTWGHIQSAAGANYKNFIDPTYDITLDLGSTNPGSYPDSVRWGRNSASMAYVLMQLPVKLYVHANDLIP